VFYVAHVTTRLNEKRLSRREQLIVLEIGHDRIDTASSFVEYMNSSYGFSKSSVWYCLNRLKEQGVLEFANRDELGKPLQLTREGAQELGAIERSKEALMNYFSNIAYTVLAQKTVLSGRGWPG
jgi:DNA-binding PadR family transcriptional regulator